MYNFYNNALFISTGDSFSDQSLPGGIAQLGRIQSTNIAIDFGRTVIEYADSQVEDVKFNTPKVVLNGEYLVTNGINEKKLGFITNGIQGSLVNIEQEKNYYAAATEENLTANQILTGRNVNVFAIGNAALENYSVSASVGDLVRANFTSNGLNVISYTGLGTGFDSPALKSDASLYGNKFSIFSGDSLFNTSGLFSEQIPALGSRDIFMEIPINFGFSTNMSGSNSCLLQDFSLNLNIPREEIYRMGESIPSRPIKFPVPIELSVNAILTKIQSDALISSNCADAPNDIKIVIKKPCTDFLAIEYSLKGMKLESQQINTEVLGRTNVSFTWRGYIPNFNSLTSNLFITEAFNGNKLYAYVLDYCVPISGVDQFGNLFFDEECFYNRIETGVA